MSYLRRKRVAIVGAGTVGLSVALRAVEFTDHSIDVTVVAAEFLSQTTSYGSGGLWNPYQIAGVIDAVTYSACTMDDILSSKASECILTM